MNLPNKLSMLRIILTVPFAAFLLLGMYLPALICFGIASITDAVDGKIARKYNLITDLGKFLDPLADKILVVTALICLTGLGIVPAWAACLVAGRDFLVDGIRLQASRKSNTVIAAFLSGKLKTALTMPALAVMMIMRWLFPAFQYGGAINLGLSVMIAILAVWSSADYIIKCRKLIF